MGEFDGTNSHKFNCNIDFQFFLLIIIQVNLILGMKSHKKHLP